MRCRAPTGERRDATPPLGEDAVEEVVASLIENDMRTTYLAVAEALGVSANRISGNVALRAVLDRAGPVILAQWCASMRTKLSASRERLGAKTARLPRANLAADAGVSLERTLGNPAHELFRVKYPCMELPV